MTNKNSLIWVLADDRPGNYSQAIGLAAALDREYEVKKIRYNFFTRLPNCLRKGNFVGITPETKSLLLNQSRAPQIIICAGRKAAAVGLFLKKYYKNVFVIQIMKPDLNPDKFDLVVLPEHDNFTKKDNIITSIGSLSRVDTALLKEEYKKFASKLCKIKSPKIALLVGGSSKKAKFSAEIAINMAQIVSEVVNNMKAHLLVTTSRRTEKEIIEHLKRNLKCPNLFFQWQEDKPNPYFAFLQDADYIIVSGDSMSMCSESCSLGKPVYIYNPEQICSKKHLKFHQSLFINKYARKLDKNTKRLNANSFKKLDETHAVAKKINGLLLSKSL